jgi:hypothetical protein
MYTGGTEWLDVVNTVGVILGEIHTHSSTL